MSDQQKTNPWDALAFDYDEREGFLNDDLLHQAVKLLPEPEVDGPILVAGAGTGGELPLLVKKFPNARFLASDVSPGMVKMMDYRIKSAGWEDRFETEACDVLALPREKAALSMSLLMIHTLKDPIAGALAQYGSLLPGGTLFLLYFPPKPEPGGPLAGLYEAARTLFPKPDPTWEEELIHDLETAGAEAITKETLASTWSFQTPKDFCDTMERLPNNQAVIRKRGHDFFDRIWHVWTANMGLSLEMGRWSGPVYARLVTARKPL